MATAAVYIGLRVTPELCARLEHIAQREHNNVSAVIRRLISISLDAEERRAKRARRRIPKTKRIA